MSAGRIEALIVVFDGLRPDMVTADVMPNLKRFSARATTFANSRSVFPSVTAVAAASIATGALPERHGVIGSAVYLPDIARDRVLDLGDHRVVRGLDQALDGSLVATETLGDVLAASRRRLTIVDAGAPAASILLNPRARRYGHWTFSTTERDATPTSYAWDEAVARFGFPPERELPRFEEMRYATDVLIEQITGKSPPSVAVLWLSEPDATSRYREIGAIETENVLRHADRHLGRVLDAIDQRQGLDRTLVVVTSDHGQITADGGVDVPGQLGLAQLDVATGHQVEGASFVFTGSGYGAITLSGAGRGNRSEVACWLMQQPWTGHVFTAGRPGCDEGEVPGTFALGLVGLAHERTADIVFTFASSVAFDRHGMPGRGLCYAPAASCGAPCGGTHGGLNPMEMSTVLMIAGPCFEAGRTSQATAGIVDIAPTVLARLGLSFATPGVGRDLAGCEAASRSGARIEAGAGAFTQAVVVSEDAGRRPEMDGADLIARR